MKDKFLKILANTDKKKDQKVYTELVKAYSEIADYRQVYHYQLGYTPTKFVNIKYEIQKSQGITDKEIVLYVPGEESEVETTQQLNISGSKTVENVGGRTAEDIAKQLGETHSVLGDLYNNPDAQQGLKLRDEYPFLNDPNCPDAFKILVSDKVTAYKTYAAKHAEALEAADAGEAEDKLYELTKDAVKNYALNQDIKAELDFFRDSNGKILGKHPLLADLKLNQDVNEMSEAELLKARNNGLKSISKYKEDAVKAHLYEFHSNKTALVTSRLENDFNHKFEK